MINYSKLENIKIRTSLEIKMQKINKFLTARDKEVLTLLFKGKVSFVEQVYNHLFKNAHISVAYKRLAKLYKYKLISKSAFMYHGRVRTSYELTKLGFEFIKDQLEYNTTKFHRSDSVKHDLVLNEIRSSFIKRNEVQRVFSESELKCYKEIQNNEMLSACSKLNSDGAVEVNKNDTQLFIALEFEATRKDSKRYLSKLTDYYEQDDIEAVFYISKNRISRRVKNAEKNVCKKLKKDFKFFFATLENVLGSSAPLLFETQNAKVIKIF